MSPPNLSECFAFNCLRYSGNQSVVLPILMFSNSAFSPQGVFMGFRVILRINSDYFPKEH
jgi:hypothetical protein